MQAEGGLGNFHISEDGLLDAPLYRSRETNGLATIPVSHSDHSFSASGVNYIEHTVSKMDTLVGVAIKYGVEVADIKRINGLVTDLQMFAHKSLQIPLPGRHPPSPILSNGSCEDRGKKTPPRQSHDDVLDSLQSLKLKSPPRRVSPAMCSLQGYYGLRQLNKDLSPEGTEMAVYKSGNSFLLEEKTVLKQQDALHSLHRKSRSLVNVILHENGDITGDISESDRFIRRRSKPDADQSLRTPEILLKEESPIGAFLGRAAKGLALRPKNGCKTELDPSHQNSSLGVDSLLADVFVSVRKSSSASNLSESENSSSIWPTGKWCLKPDVIAKPIIDGLPKPITTRRNKAALD